MISDSDFKTYVLAVDPTADRNFVWFRAPRALTVRRLTAVSTVDNGAGTAVGLTVINMGTAGTSNLGTIVAEVGGTASATRFSAGVPQTTTTIADPYVAAGEYVGIKYDETSDWVAGTYTLQLDYLWGKSNEA